MSGDSTKKTIIVALGVCLVCSVLVSSAAVALNSIQEDNKRIDKLKNILEAGNLYEDKASIEKIYKEKIEGVLIELKTGKVLPEEKYNDRLNVTSFNIEEMAEDPEYGADIPASEDIAGIKAKPKYMPVYEVKNKGEIEKYIFPIYGKGLWSTLYGFLAIDKDLETIRGITFYQHGETPGLGGEVDNPKWKASWNGKKAYGENNEVKINVIKGKVDPSNPNSEYMVDGLSGATITTRGVDNFVKYWLGEHGYGPFIENLRQEGNQHE
jgi:Na+-transporting NADH:ubiquinone oxidoreductase subunit C